MRCDTHGKRKFLQFKIRWAGYGPETDTWESWDNCKGTDAVQLYLSGHPNKRVRKLGNKNYVPPQTKHHLKCFAKNGSQKKIDRFIFYIVFLLKT